MTNKRSTIPIEQIHEEFFVRAALNNEYVLTLMVAYEGGVKIPPILLSQGNNTLVDGRHRLAAQRELGRGGVEVEWTEETDKARNIATALLTNVGGSMPPTNADIVYAIKQIMETGEPYASIAKMR